MTNYIFRGEGGIISLDKTLLNLYGLRDIGKDYDKFHKGIKSNYYFKWLHDGGSNFRITKYNQCI